jgi:hypothetical protein
MKTLQIEERKARRIYKTASSELKIMLEDTFGKEFFSQKVTDRIKSYLDAQKETGYPKVDISVFPEGLREHIEAYYQMVVIAEALNEGWKPNWDNSDEPKYYPWFWKEKKGVSSGFVFYDTIYYCSSAVAGYGLRLCFRTRELAEYAGKQFIEIWNKIILK